MTAKWKICIALLVLFISITGCKQAVVDLVNGSTIRKVERKSGPMEEWGAKHVNIVRNLSYAPDEPGAERLNLDMLFDDLSEPAPLIVNIHGGGWELGDKGDTTQQFRCRYIAAHGYVVANVDYRMLPDYDIKTQIEDVMGAVIWAKEHASEYGADPERVGVVGSSAGGHLAAMVAWASNDDYFTPTAHANSDFDSDVLAAVPFYGLFDMENAMENGTIIVRRFTGIRSLIKMKGPGREEYIRKVSPKHYVTPDVPPTFFVCGDKDNLGLYPDSVNAEKLLRGQGVDTGLYTARGAVHSFDTDYAADFTQDAMRATVAWFDKYLK